MSTARLSRREMLKGMSLVATGAVLAACTPAAAPQEAGGDAMSMETPEI